MTNYNNRTHKDILEEIVSIAGLYEKIFGKLLDKLVFNRNFENKKHILKRVYLFEDIETIFEKQIERKQFTDLSKIIFRFTNNNENEGSSFFKSKDNKN